MAATANIEFEVWDALTDIEPAPARVTANHDNLADRIVVIGLTRGEELLSGRSLVVFSFYPADQISSLALARQSLLEFVGPMAAKGHADVRAVTEDMLRQAERAGVPVPLRVNGEVIPARRFDIAAGGWVVTSAAPSFPLSIAGSGIAEPPELVTADWSVWEPAFRRYVFPAMLEG
ncbi:MAG: hypothetical protein AUG44_04660 [Actinobacteria bacterium 13_1_20CM_3_71_11]|nr:MAG: hypothetical protein AUG44_04660 [Actinobacteria bacterium 13_1_20CM_3_71_11]